MIGQAANWCSHRGKAFDWLNKKGSLMLRASLLIGKCNKCSKRSKPRTVVSVAIANEFY